MNIEELVLTDPALGEARQQFEAWRQSRTRRERIPDSLWQTAAELFHTGSYSLHTLSKTLRVNHTSLKNHVQHQESEAVDVSGVKPIPA